jgi:uncharacterized protein (TIGR00369 family)
VQPAPLQFPLRIPFVEQLGFELWGFGGGQAEVRMNIADTHLNSWEVAHGGVLMTLLDVAMAHAARSPGVSLEAARSLLQDGAALGPGVVTVEMKTTFMRPAEGQLRAAGQLLHRTATLAFCEGSVFDAAGTLCAHATATFKYLRALPAAGRTARPLQHAAPLTGKENP